MPSHSALTPAEGDIAEIYVKDTLASGGGRSRPELVSELVVGLSLQTPCPLHFAKSHNCLPSLPLRSIARKPFPSLRARSPLTSLDFSGCSSITDLGVEKLGFLTTLAFLDLAIAVQSLTWGGETRPTCVQEGAAQVLEQPR